jgi:hypothetical protein
MSTKEPEILPPIIVDAGKQQRARIKQLKRGTGKLAERVLTAAQQVGLQGRGEQRDVLPVVFLIRSSSKDDDE